MPAEMGRSVTMRCSFAAQIRRYSAAPSRSIPPAKQRFVPKAGTYPKGFLAGTSHAGVKASNTQHDDIALVVSEKPCVAAAVFTRNLFRAAPLEFSRALLHRRQNAGVRGVVVNSGCANAVTGKKGLYHANEMSKSVDQCFDPEEHFQTNEEEFKLRTLVMSTGVIGQHLPIERIREAIPRAHAALGSEHEHFMAAAQAICTTDTFPKLISRTFTLPSHPETEYRIAGMTKGAGMIHPNMGTLLGIICTDANITPGWDVKNVLTSANERSFNCISIDGDTSTNDTVALLANGAAAPEGSAPLRYRKGGAKWSGDEKVFHDVLVEVMTDLAQLVVRDGEGATKFITVEVMSPHSKKAAQRAAASIATSALVKTAMYGQDANWGRILCAIGYAPGIVHNPVQQASPEENQVNPEKTSVSFIPADGTEELKVFIRGRAQDVDEKRAKEVLEMEEIKIVVWLDELPEGGTWHTARYWTCDFSHEYVTINGDYRT